MTDDSEVARRFQSKVRAKPGCWEWLGPKNAKGYGYMWADGKNVMATRLALQFSGRKQPSPDMLACHTCDNPGCVNPDHLWWGTNQDNLIDARDKQRMYGQHKTHCIHGHKYTPENTIWKNGTQRNCRTCQRISDAAYKVRRAYLQSKAGDA